MRLGYEAPSRNEEKFLRNRWLCEGVGAIVVLVSLSKLQAMNVTVFVF